MSKENGSESEGSTPASSPTSEPKPHSVLKSSSSKKANRVSKPRLTASQKNFNHKDAENKRRTAIRERFTELSNLVPGALGHERSEQVMLGKSTEYLREMLLEQRRLEELAHKQGITVDSGESIREDDFGGPKWKDNNMKQYEANKQKRDGDDQGDEEND
ncbi:hypothetical protein A1O7_03892 [Cladophialophora yegresii CBS 114405]|uniref:BHLH domain-containing protein n=1 Tax=Cladophialophora yegresii CBS 114405 TaxID=1182544 RepID=W9W409_9EURO|nr:uncharacterized protein A1O7_03892 [Cladophialophora yegresii CBS 114405]EXJ59745.1 hypothetical protein A1O7_03892 [Cladophialophora yegresii CBS 114405]